MAGAFPIPKYHFKVEMEGFRETSFKEVTGLSQEYDKMEYRGGGRPITSTSKRLGLIKSSTITLKKGIFHSNTNVTDAVAKMVKDKNNYWSESGGFNTTISLLNEKSEPVLVWKLFGCVPIKVNFSDLSSDSSEIAVEEMEIDYERMEYEFM